jgi:hypothetical protein
LWIVYCYTCIYIWLPEEKPFHKSAYATTFCTCTCITVFTIKETKKEGISKFELCYYFIPKVLKFEWFYFSSNLMHFFAKCSSELGIDGPLKKIVNVFLIGPKILKFRIFGRCKEIYFIGMFFFLWINFLYLLMFPK